MAPGDAAILLARFAAKVELDPDALAVLRLSMLDWAAVGLAGTNEPIAQILRAQAYEEAGTPQASMFADDVRVPARMAALVNGTTSHALDYDDTHFAHIGHTSVATLPAAMAVGELTNAGGAEIQAAALIGMEASVAVGLWLGRKHYQVGYHQTATAGAFGATLAAARLLGLTEVQMGMALGLVSTRTSGLRSQFGTMGKPMNAGLAAANGVEAALLVSKGLVSSPLALDGPQGFGDTHHGEGYSDALTELGQVWRFGVVQHKFHACCHGLHAALEALAGFEGDVDRIAQVAITTHPRWMSVCNVATPATGLEAKFSYAHVTALRLMGHDTARLESFDDALTQEPALAALRGKVRVQPDEALSEMQVKVSIFEQDGACVELSHDLNLPLPLETRQRRVIAKATSLIGAKRADHLWELIQNNASAVTFATALRNRMR